MRGFGLLAVLLSAVLSVWASSAQGLPTRPCPATEMTLYTPAYKFGDVSSQLVVGRKGLVPVLRDTLGSAKDARITMVDSAPGSSPFFTATLADRDENDFYMQLDPGDGPSNAIVQWSGTYYDVSSPGSGDCVGTISTTITPVQTGRAPRIISGNVVDDEPGASVVSVGAPSNTPCALVDPKPVEVSLEVRGRSRTFKLDMACGQWAKTKGVALPGIRISQDPGAYASSARLLVSPVTAGNHSYRYRLTVRHRSQVVLRRWLHAESWSYPSKRIYQGTDEFVNYCINKSRQVYSSNLRLYCIDPAVSDSSITINRTR